MAARAARSTGGTTMRAARSTLTTTCRGAQCGGCEFWEWCDPESEPYLNKLLLDLRNAVWSAREEINGLEAALRDSKNEALQNSQATRCKESNEVECLRAALEKIEATNCGLVDRINKQQKCMTMLICQVSS
uniref:Uncharacterized protein n=1 Tax=Oryza punctata TaxID=4537 RepID=A0A0E0MKH2_ORYPU